MKEEIQQNKYFAYRNISEKTYHNLTLPLWIKSEIQSENTTILDYGCGFGQILKLLKNNGYKNIYGVDIEKSAIKSCNTNNLNVKELDLNNLRNPFDVKFDVVILSHILEHISKNEIINSLSFIKREFLAKNGKLLIAVPNAQSNTHCYWAYEDWTHTTLFTSGSIYYILKASGFENIEFLDIDCLSQSNGIKKYLRKFFLKIYKINHSFWNKITCSSYHKPSIEIFSYEIKVKAW